MELENGESILIQEKGDYWEKFICFYNQNRGKYTITNKRIIFSSLMEIHDFSIRYEDIQSISKCNVGPLIRFMPTGILVRTKQGKSYRLSVLGRKKYMDTIETYIG